MIVLGGKLRKKSCCGNCKSGKPCCGSKPKWSPPFVRRGGLWLPRRPLLPITTQLQFPSEAEWGGLWRPWAPAWGTRTFDLSCLPCCTTCDCVDMPSTVTATVVATTGNCGGLLSCSTTLSKTSDFVWTGTLNCGCTAIGLTLTCVAGAFESPAGELTLQTSACPTVSDSPSLAAQCDPLSVLFRHQVDAADPICTCCFPNGGTYDIEITA